MGRNEIRVVRVGQKRASTQRWVTAMPWDTATDLREMTGNFSSLATGFILWMRGDDARSPLCRVLKPGEGVWPFCGSMGGVKVI